MLGNDWNKSAWHGTTKENAEEIKKYGFKENNVNLEAEELRNPNDLGGGIYFYIDSIYGRGYELASKYAHKYKDRIAKRQQCGIEIIEADISTVSTNLLDLDDDETNNFFIEFSEKHEEDRQKVVHKLKNDGAKQRKNYDGIMIELFIKKVNEQNSDGVVQVVKKATHTNFDDCISNFHNGIELCVRDTSCIKLKDEESVNNGDEFKKFF